MFSNEMAKHATTVSLSVLVVIEMFNVRSISLISSSVREVDDVVIVYRLSTR